MSNPLPPILSKKIGRIDLEAARTFLAWLKSSDYCYHIDDIPSDCIKLSAGGHSHVPAFPQKVAALLEDRVSECFTVLGYIGAWLAFDDKETEDEKVIALANAIGSADIGAPWTVADYPKSFTSERYMKLARAARKITTL